MTKRWSSSGQKTAEKRSKRDQNEWRHSGQKTAEKWFNSGQKNGQKRPENTSQTMSKKVTPVLISGQITKSRINKNNLENLSAVVDDKGERIPTDVKDKDDGTYEIKFTAHRSGTYCLKVRFIIFFEGYKNLILNPFSGSNI